MLLEAVREVHPHEARRDDRHGERQHHDVQRQLEPVEAVPRAVQLKLPHLPGGGDVLPELAELA